MERVGDFCLRDKSEIQSQRELPGAVSAVLGGLHALHDTGRRRSNVCRRRRKVRVIQQVRKRAFKSQPKPFRNLEALRQPGSDGGCARAQENPDATVPHRPRWNWIEGSEIKHTARREICDIAISDAVRPLE